jgi:hypothetical protein
MGSLDSFAKLLIVFGIVLAAVGALLLFVGKVPYLGRLPGDIYIQRRNFSFYIPITTSILLSIILTLVLSFLSRR